MYDLWRCEQDWVLHCELLSLFEGRAMVSVIRSCCPEKRRTGLVLEAGRDVVKLRESNEFFYFMLLEKLGLVRGDVACAFGGMI